MPDNEPWQSLLRAQGIPLHAPKGVTLIASPVRQSETWDCGIACLQMLLPHHNDDTSILQTQSVWTADLVWYLHQHESRFLFVTKSLWPNPEWKELAYYKQAYSDDWDRVTRRVGDMQHAPILQTSISIDAVRTFIQRDDCVAIALVDHNVLLNQSLPYAGHYILLAGIKDEDTLVVYNPATDVTPTYLSLETFERAWRAQGTDEDIVFYFYEPSQTNNSGTDGGIRPNFQTTCRR